MNWLGEKGYLAKGGKHEETKMEREPLEEIDLLDDMHSALVDLLVEKGIITEEEQEKHIKQRIKTKPPQRESFARQLPTMTGSTATSFFNLPHFSEN
jgi:hypothetical protein